MRSLIKLCENDFFLEPAKIKFYHGTSSRLETGSFYNGPKKVMFLADDKDHARNYGPIIYLCGVDLGNNANLTLSSSAAYREIIRRFPKSKSGLEIGELWKDKMTERQVITFLLKQYASITLFDTHSETYDDDSDFGTTFVVTHPQHRVFVEDEVWPKN